MFRALDTLASTGDLAEFARANGLQLTMDAPPPLESVGLLERLSDTYLSDSISGPGWQTGNLRARTGMHAHQETIFGHEVTVVSDTSKSTIPRSPVGFLALTLARQLPNIILDSKRNNTGFGSNMAEPPLRHQRLSLEGDFDQYFDLFVPPGYERDALYIFTPDLMALMIDEVSQFDVEIRGNQLVIYASSGLALTSPETWLWIERIMAIVGAKTFTRTDGYSDDRLGNRAADVVAPAGRLLSRSFLTGDYKLVATVFAIIVGAGLLMSLFVVVSAVIFFLM